MPERVPHPLLHVHLGPAAAGAGLPRLADGLGGTDEVRQHAVLAAGVASPRLEEALPPARTRVVPLPESRLLPAGVAPRGLVAVGRALGELVAGDTAGGRRPVQWPVPERWAVVHAHGAAALRAVWLAAAWRGSGARVLASRLRGDGRAPAGLWRKAELVVTPDGGSREDLVRRGVERRRLRVAASADDGTAGHLRLYRRLAAGERRRVQRVDWSAAAGGDGDP